MNIEYFSITDKGATREHNEDFYLNNLKYNIFMVADGMGGYQQGDVASKLALNSIISYLDTCTNGDGIFSKRTFNFAIDYANSCINNYKKKTPNIKNMGSTFISFVLKENGGASFNIGDSRIYRLRGEKLEQITKDHSAEKEVLPEFMQNANEGKYSSIITKAIGANDYVVADFSEVSCELNDIFLICSDGLYSMIKDPEIKEILSKNVSLKEICENLINTANNNGGEDNITATCIKFN